MTWITKEMMWESSSAYYDTKGELPDWGQFIADKINSHLSELQAGNRERIEKVLRDRRISEEGGFVHSTKIAGYPEEIAAAVSKVIAPPGSFEEINILRAQIAELRASMPKFKPGDVVYVLHNNRIRPAIVHWIDKHCAQLLLDGVPKTIPFNQTHATIAECRASSPVEHLKGEQ